MSISHYARRSGSLDNSDNDASLTGIIEINSTPTYELQHYCECSENLGDRLGVATASGENEIYSTPYYSANSINSLKNFPLRT